MSTTVTASIPATREGKSIECSSSTKTTDLARAQGVHAYTSPSDDDIRSVCPALNTLANHSFLPHDGKHITFYNLAHALHAGYGISIGFAIFLVTGTYVLLKRNPLKPLDLHDIGRHMKHLGVEHNGSVTHDDADGRKFAPSQIDDNLLRKFLEKAYTPAAVRETESEDKITVEDLVYTRIARQAASGPIDALHSEIARGEFAMVFDIFGKGTEKELDKKDLELWLQANRFPEGWSPNHSETLWQTISESKEMRELMESYQSVEGHGLWSSIENAAEGLVHRVEAATHLHLHEHTKGEN